MRISILFCAQSGKIANNYALAYKVCAGYWLHTVSIVKVASGDDVGPSTVHISQPMFEALPIDRASRMKKTNAWN
jgi:hypothetical protein